MQLRKYESDYLYFDSMAAAHKWGALCCSLERQSHEQQEKSPLQLGGCARVAQMWHRAAGWPGADGASQVALVSPGAVSQQHLQGWGRQAHPG